MQRASRLFVFFSLVARITTSSCRIPAMPAPKNLLGKTTAPIEEVQLIIRGDHADPFHVLGAHPIQLAGKPAIAVRAFLPQAAQASVIRNSGDATQILPLNRIHADGFFETVVTG